MIAYITRNKEPLVFLKIIMHKTRKKRLRKKLYLDEFAVLGFEFSCEFELTQESEFDCLLDNFILFIESRELCMGGGGDIKSFNGFICSDHRYESASNDDRDAIKNWLDSNKTVTNIIVYPLVDANYDT